MEAPIVFTLSQLVGLFLSACGVVTATAAAGAVIVNIINKAKAPNKAQDVRLDEHEQWLKKHDAMLDNDNKRLSTLEKSGNLTMKALLALLQHGIDGNDVEGMRKVKHELEQYLIDR